MRESGARTLPELAGREVCVLGQLFSMSQAEAFECVRSAGGMLTGTLGERTAWVVLADGPHTPDENYTSRLEEAQHRAESGQSLRFFTESEFLSELGLADPTAAVRRLYTASQLARILGIPARRLQSWVRSGLIRPARLTRRLAYFEFREVAQARALARLADSGVSLRRIRASLQALARWWPGAPATLSQLDALEVTGDLVVRTPEGHLAEPSGQLRLDFSSAGAPGAASVSGGELWFQRALRLEQEERLEEAALAYSKALDPAHPRPEVAFNLGNTLYALGRGEEACAAYALATELDPEYVEAWNNLGNALSVSARQAEAIRCFERALALEPDYADAHFNLAETFAAQGALAEARQHWRTYLEHDPDSPWAAEVHARLRRTDRAPVAAPTKAAPSAR